MSLNLICLQIPSPYRNKNTPLNYMEISIQQKQWKVICGQIIMWIVMSRFVYNVDVFHYVVMEHILNYVLECCSSFISHHLQKICHCQPFLNKARLRPLKCLADWLSAHSQTLNSTSCEPEEFWSESRLRIQIFPEHCQGALKQGTERPVHGGLVTLSPFPQWLNNVCALNRW